jgi:maltose-binding protein MalE
MMNAWRIIATIGVIPEQMDVARVRPNIPAYAAVSREVGLAVEEALFTAADPATVLTAAADRSIPLLNP